MKEGAGANPVELARSLGVPQWKVKSLAPAGGPLQRRGPQGPPGAAAPGGLPPQDQHRQPPALAGVGLGQDGAGVRCKTSLRGAPGTQVSSLIPQPPSDRWHKRPAFAGAEKTDSKNPDEARIKDLASAITATQDKLLTSFEMEKDERMARMTAIQQGQYIIEQWQQKIIEMRITISSKFRVSGCLLNQ